MSLITRLKESLISQGVSINEPALFSDLCEFEDKYQVKLPDILKEYFLKFNGTGEGNFDDNYFAFFSLAEFKPVVEIMSETEPDKYAYPDCYIFSDYLMWCWGYAVRLKNDGTDGEVFTVCGTTPPPRKISNSFAQFVELYLENPDALL